MECGKSGSMSTGIVSPNIDFGTAPNRQNVASHARPLATVLVVAAADMLAIFMAHALAFWVGRLVRADFTVPDVTAACATLGLLLLAYAASGLYAGPSLGAVEELRRIALGTALVSMLVTASLLFRQPASPNSSGGVLLCGVFTSVLVPVMRSLARHAFAGRRWWGVPAIILGAGETARMLIGCLQQHPQLGFTPVACLDDGHEQLGDCAGVPVAGPLSMTRPLATSLKIRHALIAIPELGRDDLVWMLDQCSSVFSHVILIPNLFGAASLWVSVRDIGGVLTLELRQNLLIPLNRWIKRGLDIGTAVVVGVLALPLLVVTSLWVKWVSGGSALYWQEREGEDGRSILVPKLRTMYPDAEKVLTRVLSESPEIRAEWICRFKLKQDPRILPGVGKFLRRTSFDELPQLWSVLIGEMSLVGPRPFPPYHLNAFSPRFRALRGRAKPGLTGLWQVSDRSDGDLHVQETLDTYYIRNWSLWLDIYILARTVPAVLFPRGAY